MRLNLQQLIQHAQALSPRRLDQPEAGVEFPLTRALVEQVNDSQVELVLAATISASATVGPTAFHTVTSKNAKAGGFILLMYAENTTGAPSGGTLNFTLNWTRNGGAESDTVSLALGAGTSSNYNGGYNFLNADVGTNITYEYTTTITGGETAAVRLVATLIQLY